MYSILDLRNNLEQKVLGLGITAQFRNNPAFKNVLFYVDGLFSSMNMSSEIAESVMVTESDGKISFSCSEGSGNDIYVDCSLSIFSSSSDTFSCLKDEKKDRTYFVDSRRITSFERDITEITITIAKNEEITVVTNKAFLYNDRAANRNMNRPFSERVVYNANGVMSEREIISFKSQVSLLNTVTSDATDFLGISRRAFEPMFYYGYFDTREHYRRQMFDIPDLVYQNSAGVYRNCTVSLSGQHGYRDIIPVGAIDFKVPYQIEPLEPAVIKAEIENKERDPKVIAELLRLANGRETFWYSYLGESVKSDGIGKK